jgi:hypothetical protein
MNMKDLDNRLDSIDATVFSGDLLYVKEERELFKLYLTRWVRAIYEHEQNEYALTAKCDPTLTECRRCGNDITKCDGNTEGTK